MLHHHVYNHSLSKEALTAYRERDEEALKKMILAGAAELATITDKTEFHHKAAVLQLNLSLFDALHGGYACCLAMDFVNV